MVDLRRNLSGAVALGAAALAVAGCGGLKTSDTASLVQGKTLFIRNCGSCHTLARAGTSGVVGPNLDQAFQESLHEGFGRDIIGGIVQSQIQYPTTGGTMPKLPLSNRQAGDIAAYVQFAAAKPGKDGGLLASAGSSSSSSAAGPAVEKNGVLALEANPQGLLKYTVKTATATAGPITITMTNHSPIAHNVVIQAGTGQTGKIYGQTPISTGGTHSIKLNLPAGTYTFYCAVPGHRLAGMFGTLTVK